ncbi:MAG: CHAT domain-containing tetratricopeptide repeat protein [Cyanobacteria bacterium P01_E01_bin.42]
MRNWILGSAIAAILLGSFEGIFLGKPANFVRAQTNQNPTSEAEQLLNLGIEQFNTRQFHEALQSWERALDFYQATSDRSQDNTSLLDLGNIHYALGNAYYSVGEYHQAIASYQQSIPIFQSLGQEVLATYTVLGLAGEFNGLTGLGNAYRVLGEYEKAIDYYQQALVRATTGKFQLGVYEDRSLRILGNIHYSLGYYVQAIDYYERLLANSRGINRVDFREGIALIGLGNAYFALGEHNRAIEYYEQSLASLQEMGDLAEENRSFFELTSTDLGLVYEPFFAIDRDVAGEGNALLSLGNAYHASGQHGKAIEFYQRATAEMQKTKNRHGEAISGIGLGNAYFSLKEYDKALELYQQSLNLLQALRDRIEEERFTHWDFAYDPSITLDLDRNAAGEASIGVGNVYLALGEYEKAIHYYERSRILVKEIGNRTGEGNSLYHLALAHYRQGNNLQALDRIREAISLAESIRLEIENPDLRQSFFATVSNRYQLYIEILMQLHRENPDRGYDKQALQASEKNRARTLTEILAEANLNIRQNVQPQLLQEEQRLIQELSNLEKRRLELTSGSYANKDLESLIRDRDVLLKQLSDFETRIRRNNPAYADLKYPQPLTLEEIQEQILDEDTLLLEYALGEERSYLFFVGKNEFATYELPPRQVIEAAAAQYAIALQAEDRNPLAEGKDLAQMLLSPIADKLKGQRLAIVADGKLHRLPFGALPWGAGGASEASGASGAGASVAPLLANHEIVNLSSASSLAIQRQQTENRSPAAKKVAIFADPVFSKRDSRLTGDEGEVASVATANPLLELFRDGCQSLDRLPYTRTEAENILSLVPDNQKFLAVGFDADRTAATHEELAEYEILHLSTHGCIHDNPQLSGLALSLYDEEGTQQDGFLRLQDIYNLQLNADLVVLSACQTGIGEEVSGEGVVGLTRGFMYAGARRVTVSLWNVSDRATADLMSEYYKNMLSERKSPAAALREAQLQMWKAGEYPYKWAAFVIQGDWQ